MGQQGKFAGEGAAGARSGAGRFDLIMIGLVLAATALIPFVYAQPLLDFLTVPKVIVLWLSGAAVLFCFALKGLAGKRIVVPAGFLFLAPFIYLSFTIVSAIFSINRGISLLGTRGTYMGLLTYASAIGLFVGGYVLGNQEKYRLVFLRLVTGVAVISGIVGWLQYWGWQYPISAAEFGGDRVVGFIGNPSNYGGYLALLSPLVFSYFLSSDNRRERTLAGLSTAFVLISLFTGKSSTALAVGPLVFLAMLIRTSRPRNGRSLAGKQAAVVLIVLVATIVVLVSLVPGDSSNVQGRLTLWRAGVAITAEKPLTGEGLDTLRYVTSRFARPGHKLPEEFMGDMHNLALNQAATVGLPGAAVLIVFIVILIAKGWRSNDYFELGLAGSILSFLLISLTTPEYPPFAAFFWTTAGILASRLAVGGRRVTIGNSIWLGLILAASGVLLLVNANYSVRLAAAEYWYEQASASKSAGENIDLAEKATSALPYYDYYYGYLATKAVNMSKNVSLDFLPIVKLAADRAVRINNLESKNYESLGFYYVLLDRGRGPLRRAEYNFKLALARNPYNLEAIYGLSRTYFILKENTSGRYWRSRLKRYVGSEDKRLAELNKLGRHR